MKILVTNSGESKFLQLYLLNVLLHRLVMKLEPSASIASMVALCENEVVKRAPAFLLNVVMLLATSAYEGVCSASAWVADHFSGFHIRTDLI